MLAGSLEIQLFAELGRIRRDMEAARGIVGNSMEEIRRAADMAKNALGALGAGLSAGAFVSMIRGAIDAADNLNDLSKTTRIAIQDLQGLKLAANQSGGDLEGIAASVNKLATNMGKDAERFKMLGITAKDPLKAFEQLADVFSAVQDPQMRAALGAEALGKSWQSAAPLLSEGGEKIAEMVKRGRELAGVTQEMADQADEFNDKLAELGASSESFKAGLAGSLLPLLNALASDLDVTGTKAKQASDAFDPLRETFRALLILGGNVAFTFRGVGTEIGGIAAQIALAAKGDFAGARRIGDMMKADAENARAAFDAWEQRILSVGTAADKVKKAVGEASKAEQEAASAAAKAASAKAAAFLKQNDEAAKAANAERQKEAALMAQLSGVNADYMEQLSRLSKLRVSQNMSEERYVELVTELIAKQPGAKKMMDDQAKAVEESAKALQRQSEELAKFAKMEADVFGKSIEDATRQAEQNEELARTYGMTKAAIEAQTLASLEDQLAKRSENALTLDQIEQLKQLIELKKRSVAALNSYEAQEANKKAADDMAAEFKRASEQIGQSLTDNIMRGGKSAAEYLRDLFRTLVLRPILMPIGTAIGGAMTSMFMPGMAQASTGSGKDPISMAQAASNVYGMLKSGGTFEQSITNGVQSLFDKMGLSMGSGAPSQAAQWAGKAGGTIGGYMIGSSLNSMISGQYETGSGFMTAQKVGTAIASYFGGPIGGAIAGAIGGLINRAFGMGSKEVTTAGMRGTLSANGLTGTNYSNWHQDGGWFRSDRNGTDLSAFDPEVTKRFTEGFEAIKAMSAGFAEAIGQSADSLKDYAKTFDIVLGKDQAANEKAVSDFFDNLGNEIANSLVPNLYSLQKAGESASAALQRLAGDFQATDQMAQLIGKSAKEVFGSVGIESAAARERLIGLSGGVAALSQQAQFFSQNFMTEAERLKPVSEAVGTAMASLGLSAVTTREQFKQVALSLDLTTEQGARQYASMMRLAEAFAQVHPQIEATTEAVREQADAQQAMRDQASGLLGSVDNAFSVLQSVVSREKALIQDRINAESAVIAKHKALSDSLRSTLDSMSAPGREMESRLSAQAQIKTALALAKAGGVLPDADSLKKSLSIVSKDASALYATQSDYLRDFYTTQNDIAALAGITDDALSVEEKSLKELEAQVKGLDDILESAQTQINILKGIDATGLTIAQAIEGLRTAILSAQANPMVAATKAVSAAYQSSLGRAPDAAGLEYWQQQAANGVSQSAIIDAIQNSPEAKVQQMYQSLLGRTADAAGLQFWLSNGASSSSIEQAIKSSDEYKRLRGFDVGINRVPVDMPAMIHKDEAVVPAALNPFNPNARANGLGGNTERLERLVENLTVTVERQQQALNKIANASKRSTDILEVVTEGGNAMRTTV